MSTGEKYYFLNNLQDCHNNFLNFFEKSNGQHFFLKKELHIFYKSFFDRICNFCFNREKLHWQWEINFWENDTRFEKRWSYKNWAFRKTFKFVRKHFLVGRVVFAFIVKNKIKIIKFFDKQHKLWQMLPEKSWSPRIVLQIYPE